MPRIDEVFKKSGVPTHTFVPPAEFERVIVALRTPGRCMIIEGPSGIGKTSCVKKALEDAGMSDLCLFLSARKPDDAAWINELPTRHNVGVVVIDDFHRLDTSAKQHLTDFVKTLADEEDESSKVILIGINRAGQTLVEYSPDVLHRVEMIRFGRTNIEKIRQMIEQGENALNCSIPNAEDIAGEAEGSFAMAQVLCHEACLKAGLLETHEAQSPYHVIVSLPRIREAVFADLATRFFPVSRDFATGNKLRREGRAPYLNLLKWLSETPEGVLDTKEAIAANPNLKGSVTQVIEKGHLQTLIDNNGHIGDLIHFEPKTELLTAEDPKLLYYLRHLIWSRFARQVGYFSIDFKNRYDFALSFAGENRNLAEAISKELTSREISVFYDINEQHRIVANDVEEYLAPIYRSEAQFVVVLLSTFYPKKFWTKFESDQFKHRFGENSVIPIWFTDALPGTFDSTRSIGGLSYNENGDLATQVLAIADTLANKLKDTRQTESSSVELVDKD